MPDEEVHLHPDRPPTEDEHQFALAVIDVLRSLLGFLGVVAFFTGIAAFIWGAFVLLSGGAGDATAMSGLCILWAAIVAGIGVLFLLCYSVEWVQWASKTKPVVSEQEKDWRNLDQ